MSDRNFQEMREQRWLQDTFVCVGLDSEHRKIPESARKDIVQGTMTSFNCAIVDATQDLVCAYKLNLAFYAAEGIPGHIALRQTIEYIKEHAPGIPIILDTKDADIGNTNKGYVRRAFDELGVDAITVHPYLGQEALQPFLDRKEKGIIVLCRTSNPGAGEFQDLEIFYTQEEISELVNGPVRRRGTLNGLAGSMPLYQHLAYRVANHWDTNGNCVLVVGATYPEELAAVREIVGDMPILIPGIGKQQGDLEKTVAAGRDNRGQGMIINSSRGVIFASDGPDFAEAARRETIKLRDAINQYRKRGFMD